MSYLQEKLDIENYFKAQWSHTPIVYENDEYNGSGDEWVRLSIQNAEAKQVSMGDNPSFRYIGIVFVQIFTRTDIGSGRAIGLADLVEQLFKNLVLTNLRFKVPQVTRMPTTAAFFQVNVSTDFYRGS